jgi:hypothetical protein
MRRSSASVNRARAGAGAYSRQNIEMIPTNSSA